MPSNLTQLDSAEAMALNIAAWTANSIRPYAIDSHYETIWWRDPSPPSIYLPAATIRRHPQDDTLDALSDFDRRWHDRDYGIYECFGTYDLSSLGLRQVVRNPWYLRPAAPISIPDLPPNVTIERVSNSQQLLDFEVATRLGFDGDPEEVKEAKPFSQHAEATVDDPDMDYLNLRLDGQVVSSVIVHRSPGMAGIYGISTLPAYRRRGFATALVAASVALQPELPMSVFPAPESVPAYSCFGFEPGGHIAIWKRER